MLDICILLFSFGVYISTILHERQWSIKQVCMREKKDGILVALPILQISQFDPCDMESLSLKFGNDTFASYKILNPWG